MRREREHVRAQVSRRWLYSTLAWNEEAIQQHRLTTGCLGASPAPQMLLEYENKRDEIFITESQNTLEVTAHTETAWLVW